MDYFHENGCRLSDHAVDEMSDELIEKLIFLGREYAKRNWVHRAGFGSVLQHHSAPLLVYVPDRGDGHRLSRLGVFARDHSNHPKKARLRMHAIEQYQMEQHLPTGKGRRIVQILRLFS